MRMRAGLLVSTLACLALACGDSGGSEGSGDNDETGTGNDEVGTDTVGDESGSSDSGSGDTTTTGDGDTMDTGTETGPVDPFCGDGNVDEELGEDCDDGNMVDTDACTSMCLVNECGDGIVNEGVEECDDGNDDPLDGCSNECLAPACGDGLVNGDEECDAGEGNNGPGLACNAECMLNVCGDGDPGPEEGCDDGNDVDDDECSNDCISASCGDGEINGADECDDGNDIPDDECTNVCKLPACGDSILQVGEECDEGGGNSPFAACTTECLEAACGDGFIWAGQEECDDGVDNGPGQACNELCFLNFCGDGDVGPDEECDDGEGQNGPGLACNAECALNVCGDGDPGPDEQCDDGNDIDDDLCSNTCLIVEPPPEALWCGNKLYECGDTLDNDMDGLVDLEDPDCTTPCDDKEDSLQTDLPGQNNDCKADCYWDADSGQGNDNCIWNLKCDPENPGVDVGCPYDPNLNPQQCSLEMPQTCLDFCVPLVPNGCDCFGCCEINGEFIYLDSNPECSMDNLAACNNCTFFDNCANECVPENCELCFGQNVDDLPEECQVPSCDFGTPCLETADCAVGEFCQTGCCSPIVPG